MGHFKRIKNTNTPLTQKTIDLAPRWMLNHCTAEHKIDKDCSKYKTYQ